MDIARIVRCWRRFQRIPVAASYNLGVLDGTNEKYAHACPCSRGRSRYETHASDKERRRDESRVEKATLGRGDNIDPQERAQRRAYRAG